MSISRLSPTTPKPPPATGNQRPIFCSSRFVIFPWTFHMRGIVQSCVVFLYVAAFIQHDAFKICPCRSIRQYFFWLDDSPLCGLTTFGLSIHQLVDTQLLLPFHCRECCLGIFQECKGAPVMSQSLVHPRVGYCYFFFFGSMQGMWDLSSPTRDQTSTLCIGSPESKPLDPQGNPRSMIYCEHFIYALLLLSIFLFFLF